MSDDSNPSAPRGMTLEQTQIMAIQCQQAEMMEQLAHLTQAINGLTLQQNS